MVRENVDKEEGKERTVGLRLITTPSTKSRYQRQGMLEKNISLCKRGKEVGGGGGGSQKKNPRKRLLFVESIQELELNVQVSNSCLSQELSGEWFVFRFFGLFGEKKDGEES